MAKGEDKDMRLSLQSTTNMTVTSTLSPWSPYHNVLLFPCTLHMILVV